MWSWYFAHWWVTSSLWLTQYIVVWVFYLIVIQLEITLLFFFFFNRPRRIVLRSQPRPLGSTWVLLLLPCEPNITFVIWKEEQTKVCASTNVNRRSKAPSRTVDIYSQNALAVLHRPCSACNVTKKNLKPLKVPVWTCPVPTAAVEIHPALLNVMTLVCQSATVDHQSHKVFTVGLYEHRCNKKSSRERLPS